MTDLKKSGGASAELPSRAQKHLQQGFTALPEFSLEPVAAASGRDLVEEQTIRQGAVVSGIARIFHEALTCRTEEELGRVCLRVAEEVTQSKFGFIGELNPQSGKMHDVAVSDPGWAACRIQDPSGHGALQHFALDVHGIYGRVLHDGRSLLTNDPPSHPDSIGIPFGHPPLTAFLGVPLIHAGKTIGIIGLGNRDGGFRPEEQEAVEALAPAIVQAFLKKRAEDALRLSEERLALAASGTRIGMFEWNVITGECLWTEQVARSLGFSPPPTTTTTALYLPYHHSDWVERIHPEDSPSVESELYRSMSEHLPFEAEYRVVWPDGSEHWMMSRGVFHYDEHGLPQRMLGTLMDITARKHTEEQRQQFASLVENSHEFIGMCDILFRPSFLNEAALRMVGLDGLEQAVRIPLREFYFPEDQAFILEEFLPQVLRDGHGEVEIRFRNFKTGEPLWMLHTVFAVTDTAGKPSGFATVSRNIGERRQAEEQLKALNETLEERVKERTAEAQWRANQLQKLAAQMTQAEERERRRLAQVLHDHLQQLLVAARFRLGRAATRVQDAQTFTAITETLSLVDEAIGESRSLTKELSPPVLYDGGLAAGLEWLGRETENKHRLPVTVQVASEVEPDDLITKILVFQSARELVLNAVKHAHASSLKICLSATDDRQLQMVVQDDGTGFNTETINGRKVGVGFGLFSIRERLEVIGGRLTIDSSPLEGTKATIIAPCRRTEPAKSPAPVAQSQVAVPSDVAVGRGTRIRVLLADDHPVLRKGLADMLSEHPDLNLVGEATDGQEALEMALQVRPDVVLMDISMPRMDGIEATRQIKQAVPDVNVIGLSMHESDDLAAAMKNAGASEYLTKTVSVEGLVSAILRVCPCR